MTVAQAPSTKRRPPVAARRFGYLVAIAANAIILWVVHQLLVWEWPGFLTGEFEQVLPRVSASLIASMLVNAGFVLCDRGRCKPLGDLVTTAFGLAVSVRMLAVFPFGFAGYSTDWSWAFRAVLVVGIAGTAIAVLVNLVKLVRGDLELDGSR
jgi:hypothetical protein